MLSRFELIKIQDLMTFNWFFTFVGIRKWRCNYILRSIQWWRKGWQQSHRLPCWCESAQRCPDKGKICSIHSWKLQSAWSKILSIIANYLLYKLTVCYYRKTKCGNDWSLMPRGEAKWWTSFPILLGLEECSHVNLYHTLKDCDFSKYFLSDQ